jgi:Mg-chelatase subunit ChlD
MKAKHQVHNLIILDESGSMQSIKSLIINGFNKLVQSVKGMECQFTDQEHLISMVSFNDLQNKLLHFTDPVAKLESINDKNYNPASMTPLFDAMGFSISKLKQYLEGKTDYNVLVTVLTDGEENASKEYDGTAIKAMVDELKEKNWTFTYIGADHDVEKMAAKMSINNTMTFEKDASGISSLFEEERQGRINYCLKIRDKIDTKEGYYQKNGEDLIKLEDEIPQKGKGFFEKLFGKS